MLPQLPPSDALEGNYRDYLDRLKAEGFSGQIRVDYATRLITATDNSVYQLLPQAVIFPLNKDDVQLALKLMAEPEFRGLHFSPRGGGTGTNGQSLSDGIICDVSRDMREILEVNLEEEWVRIQPGVVLDQLNAYLAPHGYFFAPTVSPSSRATIGGMISTDASGKGSRIYGKTSKHILELEVVLSDGTPWLSRELGRAEFEEIAARQDRVGELHRGVNSICRENRSKILEIFPKMSRHMTGYNLAHPVDDEGERFDLNPLLSGSEGTLSLLTEMKMRITKVPKFKGLVALRYPDFDAALRSVQVLVESNPIAVETVDDTIVGLAKDDPIWYQVGPLLEAGGEPPFEAVNLIEYAASTEEEVAQRISDLCAAVDAHKGEAGHAAGYTVCRESAEIAALWTLRKKGVGLLGNVKGARRPIAFMEDTAVPPEHLADYIREIRSLLDGHGLRYGMFGHVDVGCLHVRPALDMIEYEDEKLLRSISDAVANLVKKYGGVMWGEHGTGFRSEYSQMYFGELDAEKQKIKGLFDPHNQLNPGKLAVPHGSGHQLVSVDAVKRGTFDRQIPAHVRDEYDRAVACNGNGACFDWDPDHVMCPSSKVTKDRVHSPKGRAGMMREWMRLATESGYDAAGDAKGTGRKPRGDSHRDFNHEVYDAMQGCLACKACATQCPVKVDVPSFRSRFLEHYHTRYRRPLKDHMVAGLERIIVLMALVPWLLNLFFRASWFQAVLAKVVGIVDSPALSAVPFPRWVKQQGLPKATAANLSRLSDEQKAKSVVLLQDAFTSFYEADVARATVHLLQKLGFEVFVAPYFENGKALHIKGFLKQFRAVVEKNTAYLESIGSCGVALVGIDPAVTLTYHDEYVEARGGQQPAYKVEMMQDWLVSVLPPSSRLSGLSPSYRFFGHCTEKTASPAAQGNWQKVFERLGAQLEVENVGCCGMCGAFGHDKTHVDESRGIFEMSWKKHLPMDQAGRDTVVSTGHSCRSQTKRFGGFLPKHPCEVLLAALESAP